MTKAALQSIMSAKVRLIEELRGLEGQENKLRQDLSAEAFNEVVKLLGNFAKHFNTQQRLEIAGFVIHGAAEPKRAAASKKGAPNAGWFIRNRLGRVAAGRLWHSRPGKVLPPTKTGKPNTQTKSFPNIRVERLAEEADRGLARVGQFSVCHLAPGSELLRSDRGRTTLYATCNACFRSCDGLGFADNEQLLRTES